METISRLIVYGDIHGCYDELISLRNKINPKQNDIEVCVGDIISKGKDSIKTLDFILEHNIKSVLGNHEDKIIKYLDFESVNKKNPITLDENQQNIVSSLTDKHISFLKQMPLYLKYGKITIVHGGLQNYMKLENLSKRDEEKIFTMRYLDENENYIVYGNEDNKSILWADIYDGNQGFVVYGHNWSKEVRENKNAVGIDTGCVYGYKLTAAIFDDVKVNQYKLLQQHKL